MHVDQHLADTLAAVTRPVAEARGLPNALYTTDAAFDAERKKVFAASWACIGFAHEVAAPGDARPVDLLGAPLLMLRDREGQLQVFQNVCRHRGMILVDAPTRIEGAIRCPYHSWCYDLTGRLRATPHVGGPGMNRSDAIDPDTTGLIEVPSATFLGAVFVNLDGTAPPFETWIAPLATRWAAFADRPLFAGHAFTLDVACNWKLAVENYCESYHLPWIHPGLNTYSRLEDHYNIEAPGFSGQGTRVYDPTVAGGPVFPDFPDLPEAWHGAAEYVALYPNVLLGVHRDHSFAIRLEPLAPGRTREHIQLFYARPDTNAADQATAARLWKEVFVEDIGVVEGMQKGRAAPGFDGGRFSPVMDAPTHAFHAWVANRLA